jgi:hypothetical protein
VIYPKQKLIDKVEQDSLGAERLELARQIAEYDPPPIMLPAALKPIDGKLLAKTAARLQRQKSVLATIKCSKTVQ